MRAEYINSFFKATKDVFNLMLDIDPVKKDLQVVAVSYTHLDVYKRQALARFIQEWIPKENLYFEKMGIREKSDLVFNME